MTDADDDTCSSVAEMPNIFHKQFTLLMLRAREIYILPAVVQSDLAESVISMLSACLTNYKELVCWQLSVSGVVLDGDAWSEILSVDRLFDSVARDSSSEYMLMNYLKRSGLIVEPSEYQVPNVIGGTFYYVPILHVLEKLLSHGDIDQHLYEQTCSSSKQEKTVLESICDAEVYGTDTFFLENPDAVAINLYVDEVELCNPLGSKRGKHKVTAVYYVVSNIHSKFRSKQHLIHLALLLKHKYVKEAGGDYTEFMKPLLHDLTVLQLHGIEVAVNGHNRVLKGKLIAVSADNLSAHALGGFQQCFNRGRM